MRNIIGSPVEGDSFFDRPAETARLRRDLDTDGKVLLTAPRRVGKTSLVLRVCELERKAGTKAAFLNVEGCGDELGFAEKLLQSLGQAGLHAELGERALGLLRKARQTIGGVKVAADGIDMELGAPEDSDHRSLSRALESVFRKIEDSDATVLIAIDELPEFLVNLSRKEEGPERVRRLLHWLRSLRQTYRTRLRWIFLGSVGLDAFVEERDLGKTVNDLAVHTLDALRTEEAHEFLSRLGASNGLPLSEPVRNEILAQLGWALPHHLQLMFHTLRDLGISPINVASVSTARERLLSPDQVRHFDTWRQRLNEQLTPDHAEAARGLLGALSSDPQGRTRSQLLAVLMASRPGADPGAVEDLLSSLLLRLQRDGYLLESDGRYAFRSFLLREFWHRREIR